ncbi:MAG: hypothetical protein RLZZ350_355, partial [Verrucomicrobiota bacterium]
MRAIGHLEDAAAAKLFGDFLFVQGVENHVEDDPGHGWAVWVENEDDLERGERLLREFHAAPTHPRFRAQASSANDLRAKRETASRASNRKYYFRQAKLLWYQLGFGPITTLLTLASLAVSSGVLLAWLGHSAPWLDWFFFSVYSRTLPEIRHGEVWRLFTPMFIHFSFFHIFFNLLWLRSLGTILETREGSLRFFIFVLVLAALSNGAQYLLAGPNFGGMSGVIYGLFGYVWVRGRLDLTCGFHVPEYIVVQMLVGFVVCWLGVIG